MDLKDIVHDGKLFCVKKKREIKSEISSQWHFKEIDCESEMNIIREGDSEKENIDVKTSAREETHSLEDTSIAIQTDLSTQDIEELQNSHECHHGCL